MEIKSLIKYGLAIVFVSFSLPMNGQDLMAMQAPIDVKLRAIDSVAIRRLRTDEQWGESFAEIYPSWENQFLTYEGTVMPEEYKIDLRNFSMPCESRVVNSHYGYRRQFRRYHYGTDIKGYMGDTIRAAFDGKVRIVTDQGYRKGYGKYVVIRHKNGLETIYGHMMKQLVDENQVVKAGEPIGLVGSTGRSTGPHLHFETRLLGEKIDPELLFCFELGDIRGDYFVYRSNGRSQLMAAHDVTVTPEDQQAIAKAEESRAFQQQKMAGRASNRAMVYKVRSGDTLSKIAKKHGITVDRLCRLNNISKNKVLRPGQILKCS